MKKLVSLLSLLFLVGMAAGCDNAVISDEYEPYYDVEQYEDVSYEHGNQSDLAEEIAEYEDIEQEELQDEEDDDRITIYIPRELFFAHGSIDAYISYFEEFGGIVEFFEDADTFWRNYPENAGTEYIEVSFPHLVLAIVTQEMESEILLILDSIVAAFDTLTEFEKESDETATRIVFMTDFDELGANGGFITLLDFTFPSLSVHEYLRRIFNLETMANLEEILFYFQDSETQERMRVYCFFSDAPLGLSMRHGH